MTLDQHDIIQVQWRRFKFELPAPLITASSNLIKRSGWLLRLENNKGNIAWGEAAPLESDKYSYEAITKILSEIGSTSTKKDLENTLKISPPTLRFAIGCALGELEGELYQPEKNLLEQPLSAWLLPAGKAALSSLIKIQAHYPKNVPLTLKWKVGVYENRAELKVLQELLNILPIDSFLRLDANGGWTRSIALNWVHLLRDDSRLQWIEQPLHPTDHLGLEILARYIPIALDESLRIYPSLRQTWSGWQVRRPTLEGDPRLLLRALRLKTPRLIISTSMETGIGRRWINHLATLQGNNDTPVAPGLAPNWHQIGNLFNSNPEIVWEAAIW